jgi:hypothetical protein
VSTDDRPDELKKVFGERTVYDNPWVRLTLVDTEPPGSWLRPKYAYGSGAACGRKAGYCPNKKQTRDGTGPSSREQVSGSSVCPIS